jgi:glucosamine-6-phosphate deaminase
MEVAWCADGPGFARRAAGEVCAALETWPDGVVALPTGRTPLGLYAELVRRVRVGSLDVSRARFVNLDEYAGLGPGDPRSYAQVLNTHLLYALRLPAEHVRLLRGDAPDLAEECRAVDAWIERRGGIALAILGLGENGHIAFNEPGADWESTARVVRLSERTIAAHRALAGAATPDEGLTLGIRALRAARRVLLLVSGAAKRDALAALLRGAPDGNWPVTSLFGHPALTVVADAALSPRP